MLPQITLPLLLSFSEAWQETPPSYVCSTIPGNTTMPPYTYASHTRRHTTRGSYQQIPCSEQTSGGERKENGGISRQPAEGQAVSCIHQVIFRHINISISHMYINIWRNAERNRKQGKIRGAKVVNRQTFRRPVEKEEGWEEANACRENVTSKIAKHLSYAHYCTSTSAPP